MPTLINTKLAEHRGKKRIYVEGAKLAREGYAPAARYDLTSDGPKRLVLKLNENGRYKISKRSRNGHTHPIIDISHEDLATIFSGVNTLRVLVAKGKIVITAHFQEGLVAERVERLLQKLASGEPLRTGTLFHGGGVLDAALHKGFKSAGVSTKIGAAVEIESKYLDASLLNNPELWDEHSIAMHTPIQELDLRGKVMPLEIVVAGIPCTGSSRAGRSANNIQYAEEHELAGALFFNFLSFIQAVNPAIVIAENVPSYSDTAGMAVVRSVLGSLGYEVQERVMCGNEFGALEKRKRLCIVGISKGLEGVFDITTVAPLAEKPATLGDVLIPFEDVPAERWKTFDNVVAKEKRDIAAGKGFKRQLVSYDSPSVGTIPRGYNKARSSEAYLVHPTDDRLTRLFYAEEHARLKKVPESIIQGLSETTAHEILGQGVIFSVFEALGQAVGQSMMEIAANDKATPVAKAAPLQGDLLAA